MWETFAAKHLKEAGKSYMAHACFALSAGVLLVVAGVASIIHALIPALFPFYSANIVMRLADKARSLRSHQHQG
jgi:branched-subunit amino acid permease